MPRCWRCVFSAAHAGFRVVEDRRGERGVGAAGGEDVDEIIEAAGAARRDHRDRHGATTRRRSARSRSRPWCRRGRSRSAGSRRRRALRPRAPTRRRRGRRRSCRCARRPRTGRCPATRASRRSRRRPPGCRSARRSRVMSAGSASAAVFRLTLSAPASTAAAASASVRMPPPTASGMNSSRATARDGVGQRAPRLDRRGDVEDDELVDAFERCSAAPAPPDRPPSAAPRS